MKSVVLIAMCFSMVACQRGVEAVEKTVVPVRVAPVEMYQPQGGARYSASILPGRQVSLAFRVSGIVTGIRRNGGRGVDAAKESHKSAAAQLAQATASHAKAKADFARSKTLIESQSLTRPEFDAAQAQLDTTAAQVEAARAQLDATSAQVRTAEASLASANLAQADTALVAPFNGSVVERNIDVGMLAGPSMAAYALADIGSVKAAFGVPDTVMVQLRRGRRIGLTVEALPGREFHGTVSAIAAVADAETRLYQVEITLANPQLALKPGMIASLMLSETSQLPPVPVVPLSAVVRDRTDPSAFS